MNNNSFNSKFNMNNNSFDSKFNMNNNFFNSKFNIIGNDENFSGTKKHNELINRDLPDQHPIKSITGLEQELEELKNNQLIGNYAGADYSGGPALLAEKLLHTLTIGEYNFDGTEDVLVPTYDGSFNNDDLIELLTLEIERIQNNMQMTTQNNMQLLEENNTQLIIQNNIQLLEEDNIFQMTIATDSNNMTLI